MFRLNFQKKNLNFICNEFSSWASVSSRPGRLSVAEKCVSSTSCKDARASLVPTVAGIYKPRDLETFVVCLRPKRWVQSHCARSPRTSSQSFVLLWLARHKELVDAVNHFRDKPDRNQTLSSRFQGRKLCDLFLADKLNIIKLQKSKNVLRVLFFLETPGSSNEKFN